MKRNKERLPEPLKVLSLFSGCGGMDLGFEGGFSVLRKSVNSKIHPDMRCEMIDKYWVRLPKTRFMTVFANDISGAAKASWIPYFSDKNRDGSCFRHISIVDLVKAYQSGDKDVFPFADIVTGGFPCQDFSVAGKRKGFSSHKGHHGGLLTSGDEPTEENRGKLYMWMRRVIEIVKPKIFVAENVKGLVSLADAKEIIRRDFSSIGNGGYLVVNAKVLFAPEYGVPQTRERVVFIGFRKSALTKHALNGLSENNLSESFNPYPIKTHGSERGEDLMPFVTVKDALVGLREPEISSDAAQRVYSKAKWYGRHCQGQSQIDLFGLGPTIRAEHHGNIEFRRLSKEHGGNYFEELKAGLKERRLTVRECARIQAFPDDFEFVRSASKLGSDYALSSSDGYRLVGNAVPPLLAFHLAWRLQELWPRIFKKGVR